MKPYFQYTYDSGASVIIPLNHIRAIWFAPDPDREKDEDEDVWCVCIHHGAVVPITIGRKSKEQAEELFLKIRSLLDG